MKLISHLYQHYHLMPSLQLHQYRVAAVASMIIEHYESVLERQEIISACLLHDMGNILKFDLSKFPKFNQPEGQEYWENIKAEFAQKYGNDEYEATKQIVAEIGVSARTMDLIDSIGFHYTPNNYDSIDIAKKICKYADYRVIPQGITSLEARWQDLETRYAHRYPTPEDAARRQTYRKMVQKIESDIFAQCAIKPDQITEAAAGDTIAMLHNFVVS